MTFTYQATDKAGATSNAATVSVVVTGVNDVPVTVLPGAQIVPTGLDASILGITTADIDHGAVSTIVVSAGHGTLSATTMAGEAISGANTPVLTLSGTPAIVTAMLASLTYTSGKNASDRITVVTSDGIATIANGSISVTVDPGPALIPTAPAKAGHGQTVQVATVAPGLAGDTEALSVTAAGRDTLVLANGVVTYVAPASGTGTISYTVTDQLGDRASGTVAVTVDSGPALTPGAPAKAGHGQIVPVATVVPEGDDLLIAWAASTPVRWSSNIDQEVDLQGMAATIEIKTGDRRIIGYIFSPLVEIGSQALKER